jgi:Ca-activated chloride channel family protein
MRRLFYCAAIAAILVTAGCSASRHSSGGSGAPNAGGDYSQPYAGGSTQTKEDNASTFALDVDTASYSYARRLIADGQRPSPNSVRAEEFINALNYDYPQPSGDGFAVHVDGSRFPESAETVSRTRLVRVGLQTLAEDEESRSDATLTFVIDVSGSMGETGKLDLVQDALHYLVGQLRPDDAVAIVTFNERAHVIRKMTRVAERADLDKAIDSLRADGSTNLGAGLIKGYDIARESFRGSTTNRVILLSDGLANTGLTDADPIVQRVREEAAHQIALLGVGVGSDYGDQMMEQLADKGDGFVVYVSERSQARDLFIHKLPATLAVRAYDAKAQVVFDQTTVSSYKLIGYEDRKISNEDFRDDRVDGGEVGPGHAVTALYVVTLNPAAVGQVAQVKVRWLDPKTREAAEQYTSVSVADIDGDFGEAAPGLRACYAAGFFAEYLRGEAGIRLADLTDIIDAVTDEVADRTFDDLADVMHAADRI